MKVYRLILIAFLIVACSNSDQGSVDDQTGVDTIPTDVEVTVLEVDTPTPMPPLQTYNACEMLTVEEISAANFSEFEVGSPTEGTDPFVSLGEAVSCRWDVGNPSAQFHQLLNLSIILLTPGEDPVAAFEARAAKLIRTQDISGVGERAVIDGRSETLLVLDGNLVFFLSVNFGSVAEGTVDELLRLANLVVSRK